MCICIYTYMYNYICIHMHACACACRCTPQRTDVWEARQAEGAELGPEPCWHHEAAGVVVLARTLAVVALLTSVKAQEDTSSGLLRSIGNRRPVEDILTHQIRDLPNRFCPEWRQQYEDPYLLLSLSSLLLIVTLVLIAVAIPTTHGYCNYSSSLALLTSTIPTTVLTTGSSLPTARGFCKVPWQSWVPD